MKTFDFGISCVYSKDEEFVKILKKEIKKKKKTFYGVNYDNIDLVINEVDKGKLFFKVFIDLSSSEHPVFSFLIEKLHSKKSVVINSPESVLKSFSKSKLHKLFENKKLPVRKTFILSGKTKKDFKKIIKSLKVPFVLSPSNTFYENDVVLNANKVEDIENFLDDHSTENVLVQEYVVPKNIQNKVAWFRSIFSCGKLFHHWWDPQTHFYQSFKNSKQENEIKPELESYLRKVAEITELKLFSTEIIIDQENKYVIIDYANVPVDLSSQEYEGDGVPVKTLKGVAESIVEMR